MERPDRRHGDNLYPVSLDAKFGDHELHLDVPAGVWNPTPNAIHLGNMLANLDFSGRHVLELGTGCGIHAILIARRNAAKITMTDIDQAILDNARHNLKKHEVTTPCEYVIADWMKLPPVVYDVLVANPPFAKSGKRYRRYFIDTMILDAHQYVRPGGSMIFVHSSMADVPRSIRLMEECGMGVRMVGETDGPFRDYYFEDELYMKEMASVPGAYSVRDGTYYERLIVFQATMP